jgi:hypothetical protein
MYSMYVSWRFNGLFTSFSWDHRMGGVQYATFSDTGTIPPFHGHVKREPFGKYATFSDIENKSYDHLGLLNATELRL